MELVKIENKELVKSIQNRLPAIQEQTRIFDRTNSQTTLTLTTLTMLNGQSPMRMLRQTLAEIEKRQSALYEAQYNLAKKKAKLEKVGAIENKSKVDEANIIKLQYEIIMIENKANGSMKDIATMMDAYDNIKANNDIDAWSEADFEQAEKAHHVRRGFELLYRNLVELGRGKEASLEYLQQHGVHAQVALKECGGYITYVEELIKEGKAITSSHLEDFLDEMREKYGKAPDKVSERLFGKADVSNQEYMTQITHKE